MNLVKVYRRNPGDGKAVPREEVLSNIKLYKYTKLNFKN